MLSNLVFSTILLINITMSCTMMCQVPRGPSPQVATEVRGQLTSPALEVSRERALSIWTLVPEVERG